MVETSYATSDHGALLYKPGFQYLEILFSNYKPENIIQKEICSFHAANEIVQENFERFSLELQNVDPKISCVALIEVAAAACNYDAFKN